MKLRKKIYNKLFDCGLTPQGFKAGVWNLKDFGNSFKATILGRREPRSRKNPYERRGSPYIK